MPRPEYILIYELLRYIMNANSSTAVEDAILERWITALDAVPEVDLVWLEGSLVDGTRATPASDIDVRVAVADDAFARL